MGHLLMLAVMWLVSSQAFREGDARGRPGLVIRSFVLLWPWRSPCSDSVMICTGQHRDSDVFVICALASQGCPGHFPLSDSNW